MKYKDFYPEILSEINIRKKGSCMYYAEKVNDALIKKGMTGYKVVEGYVRFKKDGGKSFSPYFEHTWIEMRDGRIIDKTKVQFSPYDISTIQYMVDGRKEYTPEEYKKLCSEHPVDKEGNSIVKESISGFSRPTHWFYEDFGMKVGIELKGDSNDLTRKSLANSAKYSRIRPWINEVKNRLLRLKYNQFPLDMIFNYRDFEDEYGHVGYATYNTPSDYYISLNINYLSGKISIKTIDSIDTIVHEWSHIWFFLNETDDMRRKIKTLLKNLRGDYRKLLPYGPAEEYALSDDDGDELWAYLNTHYFELQDEIQDAYWNIRDDRKESNSLLEEYPITES